MLNKQELDRAKSLFHQCVNYPDPAGRTIIGYLRDENQNRIGMACAFLGDDGEVWFRWSKLHYRDKFDKYEGFNIMLDPNRDALFIDDVCIGDVHHTHKVPKDMADFLKYEMLPRAIKYFRLQPVELIEQDRELTRLAFLLAILKGSL